MNSIANIVIRIRSSPSIFELWKVDRLGHYHYFKRYYFHSSCVVIVMFNTQLDDFSFCRFKSSTMHDDLFEDVFCKQNELFYVKCQQKMCTVQSENTVYNHSSAEHNNCNTHPCCKKLCEIKFTKAPDRTLDRQPNKITFCMLTFWYF